MNINMLTAPKCSSHIRGNDVTGLMKYIKSNQLILTKNQKLKNVRSSIFVFQL